MYTISGTIFNTDFMSKYFGWIESSKIHCPKFYLFLTHGTRERSGERTLSILFPVKPIAQFGEG